MNTQRWIALGMIVLLGLCIASSNLWLAPLLEDDDEANPPTPEGESVAEGTVPGGEESEEGEAGETDLTPTAIPPTETPAPTMDPVVASILSDLEMEELGIGLDPFITRTGDFTTVDPMHRGEGRASVYQLSDTQRVLRLEPFNVTDGPDLRVILSQQESPRTSAETLLPSYLDLGPLRSPSGAQNYEIPEGQSLVPYKSVVIYSMSLNIVYSSATLREVRGQ